MFDKFTEAAVKVMLFAQKEAKKMKQQFIGTEQILLGVLSQHHSIGARALRKSDITLRKARKEVRKYVGEGKGHVSDEIVFTPRAKRVLEMSLRESKDLGHNYVGPEHLLLAIIAEKNTVARRTLDKLGVDFHFLRLVTVFMIQEEEDGFVRPLSKFPLPGENPKDKDDDEDDDENKSNTSSLDNYAVNLTQAAMEGTLDPVIGRDKEVEDVITILMKRTKNNPVLIGEPGVGKTAIAEGLAQLIVDQKVHDSIDGHIVMMVDLCAVLAGTKYRGEFEERLKRIMNEAQGDNDLILAIDEIHTIVGAGATEGSADAANILKPALARGKIRFLGATTRDEYKKYIERDAALERRFCPVEVPEPTVGTTIEILRGLRSKFEYHHALSYSDESLEQSAILAKQYIKDRFLPDKAIDLIDEAGARVRLENKNLPTGLKTVMRELQQTLKEKEDKIRTHDFTSAQQLLEHEVELRTYLRVLKKAALADKENGITRQNTDVVTDEDICKVISNRTGIPVTKVSGEEATRLLKMEDILHERIVGQEQAVKAVAKAIRRARVNLRDSKRPIASFIFAGPTGVGKTEISKALAEYMFNDESSLIRFDMSEYMEKHTIAKLIGSPPGYVGYMEGGRLSDLVRANPFSVVLFDEVEKAYPDIFNVLLQILDDGRLTDAKGRLIDFTNTIIIMTTNLGAKKLEAKNKFILNQTVSQNRYAKNEDGFRVKPDVVLGWEPRPDLIKTQEELEELYEVVDEELKRFFRPEFLNRIDEIIMFTHLTRLDIWKICGLMLNKLKKALREQKEVDLIFDDPVQAFLTDAGFDPKYGARPLRRAITKYLDDKIAEECLEKTFYPNTKICVTRKKSETHRSLYKNELEVKTDFSAVEPRFLKEAADNKLSQSNKNVDELNVTSNQPENLAIEKEKSEQKQKHQEYKDKLKRSSTTIFDLMQQKKDKATKDS